MGRQQFAPLTRAQKFGRGNGQVVTGRFTHRRAGILDIHFDDSDQQLGITDTHHVYSVERSDFVPAGDLTAGEHVELVNGARRRIARVEKRTGAEIVHNLEIQGQHVFRVTIDGILVHNSNCDKGLKGGLDPHADGSWRLGEIPVPRRAPKSETVSIFKAPQRGLGRKQFENGYRPQDFPNADSSIPAAYRSDGGKAFFAKQRGGANNYAKDYGDGVIEVKVPKNIYDEHFSGLERQLDGGPYDELPVPHELFEYLNEAERIWHR